MLKNERKKKLTREKKVAYEKKKLTREKKMLNEKKKKKNVRNEREKKWLKACEKKC